MKRLLFIFMLIPIISFSQDDAFYSTPNSQHLENINANGSGQVNVEGSPTTLYTKEHNEISGTKYLSNNWSNGYLILNNAKSMFQDNINYDLLDGNLIVKSKDFGVYKVTDNRVTGFIIRNKNSSSERYFEKLDFSKFESHSTKTKYYEIILNSAKTNYLIKETKKYINDPTNTPYQPLNRVTKEYKERLYYYIKNKSGKYVKTKLNKKSVLKILNDKVSELKRFASTKNLDLNKEHDVILLLNYYHTL